MAMERGTIVTPDGTALNAPATILTDEEATLLRAYKAFKLKYGVTEENHCVECFANLGPGSDGMKGFTTDHRIVFACRCRQLYWQGA